MVKPKLGERHLGVGGIAKWRSNVEVLKSNEQGEERKYRAVGASAASKRVVSRKKGAEWEVIR